MPPVHGVPRCGQVVERDHAHAVPARHLAGDRVEEGVLVDDERLAIVSGLPATQRLAHARRSRRWPVCAGLPGAPLEVLRGLLPVERDAAGPRAAPLPQLAEEPAHGLAEVLLRVVV